MFDVLGVFSPHPNPVSLTLPKQVLPGARWARHDHRTVSGQRLQATYLERSPQSRSHFSEDGLHFFVVGEPYATSKWPEPDNVPAGPLTAQDVMSVWHSDPQRFLAALKGNFIIVSVNEAKKECVLYNSRYGISPFYYALSGDLFIFSTSLVAVAACSSRQPEIDPAAIAELTLFGYPLGDRTYFRQIKMLRPAEIVAVTSEGLQREKWWDIRTLYASTPYPVKQALEIGSELFHKAVNDQVCDVSRVRMSFTSGFDSRATLAVLEKEWSDVLGYSFGIPGSLNVSIPERLCAETGLPYHPIYLDGEYEDVFNEYAMRTIHLSDCLSTVERANYPYAFEKLADFSPVVITGLFGSELLRTFQNVGHIVSANVAGLTRARDISTALRALLAEPGVNGYFSADLFRQGIEDVEADIYASLDRDFGDLAPDRRFYMFLLTEGLRKYFGAEIQTERPWGTNRFPFLDDEFVEFAFRAPFAGVHSRTLKPTVQNRFNSQYFYAFLIRKYRPELLKTPTDHGYPPQDVLSPFALLKIGPKLLLWQKKRRWTGYREFKTEEWTEALYRRRLFEKAVPQHLFSHKLEDDFRTGAWKAHRLEFAKAASLKLWLETLGI